MATPGDEIRSREIRAAVMSNARFAGQLMRYHTWPVHRQQSVAEHTWQMLRIWVEIWGPPDTEVFLNILYHDVGELHAGDVPFPAKANNPDLKAAIDRVEGEALKKLVPLELYALPKRDSLRVKIVDLLEMREYGKFEMQMGNTYATPIFQDTDSLVRGNLLPSLKLAALAAGFPGQADKLEAYLRDH